ncbi:Vacuolar protease A [Alternaria alternata]|nr:Vacuolar protease A [Alternaria alternata]
MSSSKPLSSHMLLGCLSCKPSVSVAAVPKTSLVELIDRCTCKRLGTDRSRPSSADYNSLRVDSWGRDKQPAVSYPHSTTTVLLGLGKSDSRVTEVVYRVPLPEESITEDSKRSYWLGEVHTHEGRDARSLDLEDVVESADGEVVAGKSEGEVGQTVTLVTLNRVLAVEALLGTDLLVQELGDGGGKGNQRCTGVKNDTSAVHLGRLLAEGDGIEINLPVGLAPEGKLDHLASVVALVDATKGSLGLLALVGVAKVEGENRLVQETLVKHVVKGRDYALDTNSVVAKTHDAVEPTKGEGKTGLGRRLSEVLVLDLEVANLEDVLRDKAAERAGSVADLEVGAVLLVCRRR